MQVWSGLQHGFGGFHKWEYTSKKTMLMEHPWNIHLEMDDDDVEISWRAGAVVVSCPKTWTKEIISRKMSQTLRGFLLVPPLRHWLFTCFVSRSLQTRVPLCFLVPCFLAPGKHPQNRWYGWWFNIAMENAGMRIYDDLPIKKQHL